MSHRIAIGFGDENGLMRKPFQLVGKWINLLVAALLVWCAVETLWLGMLPIMLECLIVAATIAFVAPSL